MKKFIFTLCLALLLCSIPVPAHAARLRAQSSTKVRVLFIGNSYTQRNRMPQIFKKLCDSSGQNVVVRSVTNPGHSLNGILDQDTTTGKKILRLLNTQKWDYVVVQDRHRFPITKPKKMRKAISTLAPYIQNAGAKMVLYQTWAPQKGHLDYYKYSRLVSSRSDYQNQVNKVVAAIAKENNALVAPVGTAFLQCNSTYSQLQLLKDDYSHPTWTGSYLSACVMYATIFSSSPRGLSYTGKLKRATAAKLQKLAANVTRNAANNANNDYVLPDYDYEPDNDETPDYDYEPGVNPDINSDSTLESESEYIPESGYTFQ